LNTENENALLNRVCLYNLFLQHHQSDDFAGKNDPLKFNEIIINNCWLGGDDAIRTDDTLFLSIGGQIAQMIEVKQAQLKKL